MKILVTGGNGFIGSHFVDQLIEATLHQISVVDIFPRTYEPLPEGVTFIPGNIRDVNLLSRSLIDEKFDIVYHLAWAAISETAINNPIADIEQNLSSTVNLLSACLKAGVKRVVFLSSGGTVYGIPENLPIREDHPTNPISAYGITKLAAEKYVQMYHHLQELEYTILRPSVPYGPGQNPYRRQGAVSVFIYRALQGKPIHIWGDGETLRDYFYVKDLVGALMKVVDAPGSINTIFNLGGARAYTLNQVVTLIEENLNIRVRVIHETGRKFDVSRLQLDTSNAAEKLNWKPTTSLGEGILLTSEWIRRWML